MSLNRKDGRQKLWCSILHEQVDGVVGKKQSRQVGPPPFSIRSWFEPCAGLVGARMRPEPVWLEGLSIDFTR